MRKLTFMILIPVLIPVSVFSQTDQELIYTSFLGGNQNEFAFAIGYNDQNPDEFIVGAETQSQNLQTFGNSYQPFFNGGLQDAYYARINASGNITYSTFLGGSDSEIACDLTIANNGQLIIGGETSSSDFPMENPDNEVFNGLRSGWLAKFDEEDELLWSTYVGGDGSTDVLKALDVDSSGNIFMCGSTTSSDLATEGVFQEDIENANVFSGMLGKYSSEGELLWLTYFADESNTNLKSVASAPDDQTVYVVGSTGKEDSFPSSSHQAQNGGGTDAVLLAFSSLDGTLEWGTFFGGENFDEANEIVISESGNIIIAGLTDSNTGIATPGAFQENFLGNTDHFMAFFTSEGELEWSTYIGGSSLELSSVHMAVSGNMLYFGARVGSDDLPIVGNPYFASVEQSQINLGVGYMAKFDFDGNAIWSTYTNEAYPCGSCSKIAVSSESKIFCVGSYRFAASSAECEATISTDAFQTEYGGGSSDIGIFIFQENTLSTSFPRAEPLTIYPNPAQDRVTIEAPNMLWAGMNLTVTDISGRQVDRVAHFQSGNTYSTSHLSEGVYILTGQIDERMFREKLVVQR